MNNNPQERALTKYREGLAGLAGMKGHRNASLLGLASLGIMAGLPDDRILAEVRDASGTPPLTGGEIMHALKTARRDTVPLADKPVSAEAWTPPPKRPDPLGAGARDFVPRMIERGRGATLERLAACSPVSLPADPKEQTCAFLWWLYDDGDLLFCGTQTDRGEIGRNIRPAAFWRESVFAEADPPELLMANPLTGLKGVTKEGKTSYRCGACIDAYRFALVEFDAMPLESQAAFWLGVIQSGTLPLRSLTFSGGKSVHGLVEIGASDANEWERSINTLLFATCHPQASADHQADRACRNADRLTRLAGAYRADKRKSQSLLWLSTGRGLTTAPLSTSRSSLAETRPQQPQRASTEPDTTGARRCRDCWRWTPEGTRHGCTAGVKKRPSPDWRGACNSFAEVR